MDAPGDACILKSPVRQVHSCVAAALQAADGDTRTGPNLHGTQEVRLVYPRPFALALPPSLPPTPSASAAGPRETLQSAAGATAGTRSFFVGSAQASARRWPAATSFGGLVASASHEPFGAPRRFAHRTTDMAPMLGHADPCRASPCRPCRLLPALNRARAAKSRPEFSGAKAAEAVPTPGMLSPESSSSFALLPGDLLVQPLFQRRTGRETPATQAS